MKKAKNEISKLEDKYYLDKRSTEPAIYLTLTDNWLSFNTRYPTEVRNRRFLRDKITRLILDELEKKNIKIASATLDIVWVFRVPKPKERQMMGSNKELSA